jgi:hypothetical protein
MPFVGVEEGIYDNFLIKKYRTFFVIKKLGPDPD